MTDEKKKDDKDAKRIDDEQLKDVAGGGTGKPRRPSTDFMLNPTRWVQDIVAPCT